MLLGNVLDYVQGWSGTGNGADREGADGIPANPVVTCRIQYPQRPDR